MINSYLVMQGATIVAATAVYVTPHTVTFSDLTNSYAFDYRKATSSGKLAYVAGTNGVITATPTAANSTYYAFMLKQYRPDLGKWVSAIFSHSSPATGTTATTICNAVRLWLSALVSAGDFKITGSGTATAIMTAQAGYPLITFVTMSTTWASILQTVAGVAPRGTAAQLIASGIPASALSDTTYDTYVFLTQEVAAPEEGEVENTWRQLTVYVGKAATDYTLITAEINSVDTYVAGAGFAAKTLSEIATT